jgi:SNF2 family DNA or RNA helicase
MKWVPHTYQKTAVKWLLSHAEAALFLDPGLGKSSITLKALQMLFAAKKSGPALIVAPLRVCYQVWSKKGELGKWDDFAGLRVTLLHGKDKEDALEQDADLYVLNYDGLQWLTDARPGEKYPRLDRLIRTKKVSTLVFDELSKMKHPDTRRFKALKKHLYRFTRRWGLTGSPAANGLLDLFGECYCLDHGKALGAFITHYRMRYFHPTGFQGYDWKPNPGADRQIYEALKPLALSMRATDHLDLPALVEQDTWVELPPEARKFYDALEADMIAMLDGETITASNAAVVSGKCRQVAGGGIYLAPVQPPDGGRPGVESKVVHTAKLDALTDLVEELQGAPLLVGFAFRHERDRIRAAFPKLKIPCIDGETKPKDTDRIINQWNAGEIPVLLAHPQAAGHGLNLQGCNCGHVCWFSLPWDLDLVEQFADRVWRQGNKAERVIVHRLLARDTVDMVVAKTIGVKGKTQNALIDALKAYGKQRKDRAHGE